jgi:ABC-type bacteriocin/lantibiotic exporter with double-glycine peptidase domain
VGAEFHAAADGAVALDEILAQLDPIPTPAGTVPTRATPATTPPRRSSGTLNPEIPATTPPRRSSGRAGEVRLTGVTYSYAGGPAPVIRDLDLVAGPGLTVVTGPSGAGKTTLLDLVAGLRRPTSGLVESPACHYVTQRPFLAAGTVRDALTIGHAATDDQLWEALRAVEVDGVVAGLPGGLSASLGDDGFGLSAGQRQRLALARAWLAPETVLLLDEPTAHLDPDGAEQLANVVAELAERRVVIAVTHRPELLAHADRHVRPFEVAAR